jgi:hypothetical protein
MALTPRRHPLNLIRVMPAKGRTDLRSLPPSHGLSAAASPAPLERSCAVVPSSTYLARLLGPVLAVVGLSMLLRPDAYLAAVADILRNPALLYAASVLGLLGGVALVLAHNVWAADWRVVITLLGWISILDSASWILAPEQAVRFWSPLTGSPLLPLWGGALVLLLGAALSYFGYAAGRRT